MLVLVFELQFSTNLMIHQSLPHESKEPAFQFEDDCKRVVEPDCHFCLRPCKVGPSGRAFRRAVAL
jgi:hypothetical protein